MKKTVKTSVLSLLALLLILGALALLLMPKSEPEEAAQAYLDELCRSFAPAAGGRAEYTLGAESSSSFRGAVIEAEVRALDWQKLYADTQQPLQSELSRRLDEAHSALDIYDETLAYRPQVLSEAYAAVTAARLEREQDYESGYACALTLKYAKGAWTVTDDGGLGEELERLGDSAAMAQLQEREKAAAQYIQKVYSIAPDAVCGPVPDADAFKETYEPSKLTALLQTPLAKKLVGDRQLCWNEDIELLPGSPVRYYFDESILAIVWQQVEHNAVGTFEEVIVADASQFRRKLCGDVFGSYTFTMPSTLAHLSNSVVAFGGDRYDHFERVFGVYAYMGKVGRCNLYSGESCYITDQGDMLFSYAGQFESVEQAQAFVDDNRVMFSVSFGPVLIEKGVDKTPQSYPIGEINDTYARAVIGQLGQRHYLCMTLNCGRSDTPYYNLATLRQAADSMIARGCINAYTLDGGQTATVYFNGQLINPVQFGFERETSDVIYFATAVGKDAD